MKLTGAQITRMDEALRQARYYSDQSKDNEPQRHRIEMLVDDIMEIAGLVRGDGPHVWDWKGKQHDRV